jgi:site-specific recombinase
LNLGVSFYLALRLALRAQDVSHGDSVEILRTLWREFRLSPREFFFPPQQKGAPSVEATD